MTLPPLQLHFIESPSKWTQQPANFPKCAKECLSNTAPFTDAYIKSR